jgi:hypothetical protein
VPDLVLQPGEHASTFEALKDRVLGLLYRAEEDLP